MTEPVSYCVGTLMDMGRIPEDRVSAFLEELPELLRCTRDALAVWDAADIKDNATLDLTGTTWIDDGARNRTVSVTMSDPSGETEELFSASWKGER
jgi:hypothetical protein